MPKISLGESSVVAFFLGTEKIWRRGGRGVSRFSIKFFCPWGILYCCTNFGYRKSLDRRGWGGGGYQEIPSKIFRLTVPKVFVGESFAVALISGTEKVWRRGVGVSWFYVKNFLSHSLENFRRGILYCCISLGCWKNFGEEGWGRGSIKISRRKFFVSQCWKFP